MTIKEEPRSPARSANRKRKAYSTTDASSIGIIEPIDDADTQPLGKKAKTAFASSSQVRFDGVAIPKATRKSTRATKANSKKDTNELFARLAKEFAAVTKDFAAVTKTCEEISETLD
jgi:hypothetical protein